MQRTNSWLQSFILRRIITVFLVGMTFLLMPVISSNSAGQAQANTLIAENSAYQKPDSLDTQEKINNDNKLVERARRNLKENAEIARENLNLNEPVNTAKDVLDSVKNSVKDAAKAVTENNNTGYYEKQ